MSWVGGTRMEEPSHVVGVRQEGAKSIVPKWRIERCWKDAVTELVMR
jgi:hypothetical protein